MPIQLKRSAVAGKVPTTAQLSLGELAVNTRDGRLFLKKDNGTEDIIEFVSSEILHGQVAYFAMTTAPTGWLKCNGAAISRTTYADLFAAIGTAWGVGNGSTTFNLPDLRGEFLRAWDDGRGADAGRGFGVHQGDAIRNFTGSLSFGAQMAAVQSANGVFYPGATAQLMPQQASVNAVGVNPVLFDVSRGVPVANENRPRNQALLACIKY